MIDDILSETKDKMQSSLAYFEEELQGIRGGRASTALVDRLKVDYYGQESELRQIANISVPEALQILIRPYDKTSVKSIEKAIQQANIGVNPNIDGDLIRLNMPPLTRERRQELVKFLHKRMEESRVAIRNIRRSANSDLDEFEKEKMISEDEKQYGQDQVQKLTDDFVAKIDELGKTKEEEILDV
ncbi:MAG: ribosome recycling factor [Anaerolineaceae bacterium]|nr:ribosome recycling factor [Anaerolineaceae bacterium]